MNQLTPDQATALWSAGGFLVFNGLPEGSEFGIDGNYNIIRKFSGIKFLPPGLHLITWSSPSSSSAGGTSSGPGSSIPIRHGILRYFSPKERYILNYEPKNESVEIVNEIITDERLKALDGELAPYPFNSSETWKSLISHITQETLSDVIGDEKVIDGLLSIRGEEEDSIEMKKELGDLPGQYKGDEEKKSNFVRFNLKKSWRHGAIGEEVTKFSKDKSWLLADVIEKQMGGDFLKLISQLQLSFILLLHLSSYSALLVYKRILTLLCQAPTFLSSPTSYLPAINIKRVQQAYKSLVDTLSNQLQAIPEGTFDTELPELDVFYLEQIEALRRNLSTAISGSDSQDWDEVIKKEVVSSWERLQRAGRQWGWEIENLIVSPSGQDDDDEESEEEGEYAPVIVEL